MMLMQGPGGFLAGKIGTKKVVGIALLGSSLLTLCIPPAANLGLGFLLAARAVQGFTQVPSISFYLLFFNKCRPG